MHHREDIVAVTTCTLYTLFIARIGMHQCVASDVARRLCATIRACTHNTGLFSSKAANKYHNRYAAATAKDSYRSERYTPCQHLEAPPCKGVHLRGAQCGYTCCRGYRGGYRCVTARNLKLQLLSLLLLKIQVPSAAGVLYALAHSLRCCHHQHYIRLLCSAVVLCMRCLCMLQSLVVLALCLTCCCWCQSCYCKEYERRQLLLHMKLYTLDSALYCWMRVR
jgi:hypothetical protein